MPWMAQIRIFTKIIFYFGFSLRLVNHNLGKKHMGDFIHETMKPKPIRTNCTKTSTFNWILCWKFFQNVNLVAIRMLFIIPFQRKVTSKLIQFENLISNSIFYHIYQHFGRLSFIHSLWYCKFIIWIGMNERKYQPEFNLFMLFSFAIKSNEILD